ncbi:MAG: farnesyl-diphosphate synthase [Rhodovulum sulfidophilum]|uniref:Geranylgeranyl diphosphate synthase n=1 Tax=Rhodovulum sulfidophilum TaxID=35806 RepID=A0A2W5N694_RHOSU|nr:MAG: farnesyl-diphosphate synthase [Rhodovulum sulfidophilum]
MTTEIPPVAAPESAETLRFRELLTRAATDVEASLGDLLPPEGGPLEAAMRYGVLQGGKRLRAFLVLESAALFNVPRGQALRAAAAVECVHAYSLIHDDLPAMDDDDLRRGKPTVHRVWDEATAILAGDALQTLAFDILAADQGAIDPRIRIRLIQGLAGASGWRGMVGGQALDIAAETAAEPLDIEAVTALQALKTGALIIWAAEAGAILGRSDGSHLRAYAADLGLAFQIRDDILDVEGDPETAGKRLRKDEAAGKATFVSLLGLEGARARAADLVASARDALAPYGSAAGNLRLAAGFALDRAA